MPILERRRSHFNKMAFCLIIEMKKAAISFFCGRRSRVRFDSKLSDSAFFSPASFNEKHKVLSLQMMFRFLTTTRGDNASKTATKLF